MSLLKKIVTDKGIEYNYHKLSGFDIDYDNKTIQIKMKHYSSEEFRNKEKKAQNFKQTLSGKHDKLNELMMLERTEELNNEIIKVSEEINSLSENMIPSEDLFLFESSIELPWDTKTDISQTSLYNLLKQHEVFKESKDI